MFRLAEEQRLPMVVFAEGGGGRPGETDYMGVAGLDVPTFRMLAGHSGRAPTVAIVSGRCFAGNAAVAGCCDVIIATENANLGMGGPAMIEGGGLGVFSPEEVGPVGVQEPNGVIDILVADEADAVAAAKRYLAYFQGPVTDWTAADQERLRRAIPENRLRAYDVRAVIDLLCDEGSVLELRPRHGIGIITALVRVAGKPMGLIANNPRHLGGAIDAEAAEKGARFMDLCEAYGLPILSLCDTPGFMVGPPAEETALVRRVSRMFLTGAALTVPLMTWSCARATASARRPWPQGRSRRRSSSSPGRPASSAAWASKARCASPTATNSRRSRTPRSARPPIAAMSTRSTRRARPPAWRPSSRSTRLSTRPKRATGSSGRWPPWPRRTSRSASAAPSSRRGERSPPDQAARR